MPKKTFRLVAIVVGATWLCLAGCGKAKGPSPIDDPHSIDGVMQQMMLQAGLLEEAAKRKDFKYVHDYAYYMKNLAQALYFQLEDGQKAQAKAHFAELLKVINQLDASSGRSHEEATLAGIQRMLEILKELEAQLRPEKKTARPAKTAEGAGDEQNRAFDREVSAQFQKQITV